MSRRQASPVLLSDCIEEYLSSRQSMGYSKETLRSERRYLRYLLESAGNLQVRSIEGRHIDRLFAAHPQWSANNANKVQAHLSSFFKWCRLRRYILADSDPTLGRRARKVVPRDKLWIPVDRFDELLEAAGRRSSRNRIVVALGLYLLIRGGEVSALTWRDVDLDRGEVHIFREKTQERDTLPISTELERELRRWRLEYGAMVGGEVKDFWHVAPAVTTPRFSLGEDHRFAAGTGKQDLKPTRRMAQPHKPVQWALEDIGLPSHREGVHTLRRSAARALLDSLGERGVRDPIRKVQAFLGHKNQVTTELYLGINPDRSERNELVRGTMMFATGKAASVVDLTERIVSGEAGRA